MDPHRLAVELYSLGGQPLAQGDQLLRHLGGDAGKPFRLGCLAEQPFLPFVQQLAGILVERRRQVLMVQYLVLVGVDRQDRRQQRNQRIENHDAQAGQGHAVALEPPPGIQPQAHALDRLAELIQRLAGGLFDYGHSQRIPPTGTRSSGP